jgi:hypothetical protein
MAIELRRRLAAVAGTPLPAALVFNYPNPSALTTLLSDVIGARSRIPNDAEEIEELLNRIDDLSGAELDSLLVQILDEERAS